MTERLYATLGVGMEQVVYRELGALGIRVVRIEPGPRQVRRHAG